MRVRTGPPDSPYQPDGDARLEGGGRFLGRRAAGRALSGVHREAAIFLFQIPVTCEEMLKSMATEAGEGQCKAILAACER